MQTTPETVSEKLGHAMQSVAEEQIDNLRDDITAALMDDPEGRMAVSLSIKLELRPDRVTATGKLAFSRRISGDESTATQDLDTDQQKLGI